MAIKKIRIITKGPKLKKTFIAGIVIMTSLLLTLFALELMVRVFHKFKYNPKPKVKLPISRTYKFSEDKHLLFELKPNSMAEIKGIKFIINSFGFRDKKYSLKKRKKRIIFVGDSITYGWDVNLNDTYHKQFEKSINSQGYEVDVMGMGVVGYNIFQEFHLIKKKALRFNPDMIILQICPNDFQRRMAIKRNKVGNKFTLIPYHDVSIPFVIKKSQLTHFLMEKSHLYKFLNQRLYSLLKKMNHDYTPEDVFLFAEKKSFKYLNKINHLLKNRGIHFAVVMFPYRKMNKTYRFSTLRAKMHHHLKKHRIPFIDLYTEFNSSDKNKIWIDRIHPNADGYKIAAKKLENLIIPFIE
jgi:lysophospholipase L1-like esterase